MSRNLESPVQTQTPVTVFDNPLRAECRGNDRGGGGGGRPPSGRRRVFVQTEKGCVLGMELDRDDNAHTVKRRLQLALNFPMEESSLVFGDKVLKNDLSSLRNDSALLITRNQLHRSSSTPCISPRGKEIQQSDRSAPIELLSNSALFDAAKCLVEDAVKAMVMGVDPIPVHAGLGGAYYFRNCEGVNIAIVKPTDEEPFAPNNPKGFVGKVLGQPGFNRSVRVGETGFREVAAFLLDHGGSAKVPPTALVKVTHSIFNVNDGVKWGRRNQKRQVSKIASFQQFIQHDFDASDHGTSSFPVADVHRIGILDVRIFNTDRHSGNLLVRRLDGFGLFGQVEVIPIDHGLCLPENLEDPYFEWIHWPQASIPFSEEELAYIESLDPFNDSDMLIKELPMVREACLRVLTLCTIFLKEAASFGLCLAEIGEMMTREFRSGVEEPSELEMICLEAKRLVITDMAAASVGRGDGGDEERQNGEVQFSIECEEESEGSGSEITSGEEEDEDFEPGFGGFTRFESRRLERNMSFSLRGSGLGARGGKNVKGGGLYRSAEEQAMPPSMSFVKIGEMGPEEWLEFLEQFSESLFSAFRGWRAGGGGAGRRQRLRLGTSCQF